MFHWITVPAGDRLLCAETGAMFWLREGIVLYFEPGYEGEVEGGLEVGGVEEFAKLRLQLLRRAE
jgi:hypothetical protein